MAGFDLAFLQLFFKLVSRQTGKISRVDFVPQKPHFRSTPEAQPFPRATPESQGVSSAHVLEYFRALANDAEANPHQAMILRHGRVIAECSFAPYRPGMWHITHSLCKAVTGMAVGIAVREGILDIHEKLGDIFPQYVGLLARLSRKDVTIENLLDMTSGVDFSEAGAISGNEWRASYMTAPFKFEPGTKFDYNSMNSYMLSAAIQEKTGLAMSEYLRPRLFEPLGIDEVFWEKCPQGVTKGGWGMFLRPEDACKLGQLYLQGGRWNGREIVPEEWVRTSTSPHSDNGKFGYGYQIWMEERPGGFAYNGLFGQDVVCYPDMDMIVMINAGNREMTQDGSLTEIMRRFWGVNYHPSADPLPEDPDSLQKLKAYIREMEAGKIRRPVSVRERWGLPDKRAEVMTPAEMTGKLNGCSYRMRNGQIGIFPLICQVMHNNFTDGISRIAFETVDGILVVLFFEGNDIHHVRVGFDRPQTSEIILHGEPYEVGVSGRIASDENERAVLILDIAFIEEACRRQLKIYFSGDEIELRADETPGNAVIADAISYTGNRPELYKIPFVKNMIEGGGMELVDIVVQSAVHPSDTGYRIRSGK